ncbi:MAG: D-alanyl-D-alanine carboxypeptidase [Clostridia bacterium]|nr:D-alanyl-D-alanine carboxypeptidase [Clostridia bacterium]
MHSNGRFRAQLFYRFPQLGRFICFVLLLLAVFAGVAPFSGENFKASAATQGGAECVVEVSSRRFLHARNADTRLPMASTTKILTAIIVIEDCDLDETVKIPREAEGTEGSSVYLKAGEAYTVRDLLYGLMLRSGNDCAVALALHHSGSVRAFAAEMVKRANEMGAEHSGFTNPHGLPNNGHYTTARDLALVSAYAMQNETFEEIVSCKYYEARGWKNKNKMLWQYEGAIGVKTGFTTAAGRCLVTCAERNGMKLVTVLLNCPQTYERTSELLNGAYAAYQMIPLVNPSMPYERLEIKYAFSYPLTKEELEKVEIHAELNGFSPQAKGEVAGRLSIYLENNLLFSQNLYMI